MATMKEFNEKLKEATKALQALSECLEELSSVDLSEFKTADDTDDWTPPKFTGKPRRVLCIDTGVVYNSMTEAAKATGICRTQINLVCLKVKKRKTAGGYRWKYID